MSVFAPFTTPPPPLTPRPPPPPRDDEIPSEPEEDKAELGIIRVGPHAQAILLPWRPLPRKDSIPDREAQRLSSPPIFSPNQSPPPAKPPVTKGKGAAADKAAAKKAASQAASRPVSQVEAVGRGLAKGKTDLQTSYQGWAGVIGRLSNEQQRQDLLRGALAQLDEELGEELVKVGEGLSKGRQWEGRGKGMSLLSVRLPVCKCLCK